MMDKNPAQRFLHEQIKILDLVKQPERTSGFKVACDRLFGVKPNQGKVVRIGKNDLRYSSFTKNLLSFLPLQWYDELERAQSIWRGCENWWAGYPLIVWVEMRTNLDDAPSQLILNAEVGPISDHLTRRNFIKVIKTVSKASGLERIHFAAGASDKGRLYSRFLHNNSVPVNAVHNADEIEEKLVKLIVDFEGEFNSVASAISNFLSMNVSNGCCR